MEAIDRVDGWLVNRVEAGSGLNTVSVFRRVDDRSWVEEGPTGGNARFKFVEVNRDDWSVFLDDVSRKVSIQLDLHRKKVLYREGAAAFAPLYDVVRAAAEVNGLVASRVEAQANGRLVAVFRQVGAKRWVEDGPAGGVARFNFVETNRDDWSVYLEDASRAVSIQLDLHKKKVMYRERGDPSVVLYGIGEVAISDRASDPSDQPARVTFVNESSVACDVLWVDFLGVETPRGSLPVDGSLTVTTCFGHVWVVREKLSRRRLRAWRASVPDVRVPVSAAELRSTGGNPVTTTFKNLYTRSVSLAWVGPDGHKTLLENLEPGAHLSLGGSAGDVLHCVSEGQETGVLLVGIDALQYREITSGPARQPTAAIAFRNVTPLDVVLSLHHDGKLTRFHGLAPGESVHQPIVAGERWNAHDAASGRLIQDLVVSDSEPVVEITTAGLRSQRGRQAVKRVFRNTSTLAGRMYWVDSEGVEHDRGLIRAGGRRTVRGVQGDVFRLREATTRAEVAIHIASAAPSASLPFTVCSAHSRTPAALTFENRTLLTAEVMWVDGQGAEHSRGLLAPWSQVTFPTHMTHPWVLRERDSRVVLDFVIARRPQETVLIDAIDLARAPDTRKAKVTFQNRCGFAVELVDLAQVAGESVVLIQPEDTHLLRSSPGRSFAFRDPVSRSVFGTYTCGPATTQSCAIDLAGRDSGMDSQVTFENASSAELRLSWHDGRAEHAVGGVDAWGTSVQATMSGRVWVVREAGSGTVLGCTMATGTPRSLRITTERLRPARRGTVMVLTLRNGSGMAVDAVGTHPDGSTTTLCRLAPGAEREVKSYVAQVIRFLEPETGGEVDTLITGHAATPMFEVRNRLVSHTIPAEGLRPGQVALFAGRDFVGSPVVAHSNINDLRAVGAAGVASLRLGPSTGIIAYRDPGRQGPNDVFHLDASTLDGSDVGAGFGSFETFTVATPHHHVTKVTSDLAKDYRRGPKGLEPYSAYRTIVTFPHQVKAVMVWATEEVTVQIGGRSVTLYPHVAAQLSPNAAGALMLTSPAGRIGAPAFMMRSDAMQPGQRFFVFPDDAAMRRLRELPDDALWAQRDRLGLNSDRLGTDDASRKSSCAQVQQALRQLARSVPATGPLSSGERPVRAVGMEFDAWSLDVAAGSPRFEPLSPDQARAVPLGRPVDDAITLGLFDFVGQGIATINKVVIRPVARDVGRATHTVVTTVDRTARVAVQTVQDVGNTVDREVIRPVVAVVRDKVVAPVAAAAGQVVKVVGQAVDDAGRIVNNAVTVAVGAVAAVAQDVAAVVDEAAQTLTGVADVVLAFTAQVGGEVATVVVDTAAKVAQAVTAVVEMVGASIDGFVEFLESVFDWEAMVDTHDFILDLFEQMFDRAPALLAAARGRVHSALGDVGSDLSSLIAAAGLQLGAIPPPEPSRATSAGGEGHDEGVLDWLMQHFVEALGTESGAAAGRADALPPEAEAAMSKLDAVLVDAAKTLADLVGRLGSASIGALESLLTAPPDQISRRIAGLMLAFAQDIAGAALSIASLAADAAIDMLATLVTTMRNALEAVIEIPLLSDLYRMHVGRDPSMLGLLSLLIAVPSSVTGRLLFGRRWPPSRIVLGGDSFSGGEVCQMIGLSVHYFKVVLDPILIKADADGWNPPMPLLFAALVPEFIECALDFPGFGLIGNLIDSRGSAIGTEGAGDVQTGLFVASWFVGVTSFAISTNAVLRKRRHPKPPTKKEETMAVSLALTSHVLGLLGVACAIPTWQERDNVRLAMAFSLLLFDVAGICGLRDQVTPQAVLTTFGHVAYATTQIVSLRSA